MQNVPWHHEVKAFCETLVASLGDGYSLACEHEHSCCVLIAKTSFRIDGVWHTHVDYERFHELIMRYYATGETFSTLDYVAPTPEWALYGSVQRGFDPRELRWRRQKDGSVKEVEYKASESGCG
jgi:tRNA wybutosine-synthesizing protein 1